MLELGAQNSNRFRSTSIAVLFFQPPARLLLGLGLFLFFSVLFRSLTGARRATRGGRPAGSPREDPLSLSDVSVRTSLQNTIHTKSQLAPHPQAMSKLRVSFISEFHNTKVGAAINLLSLA